MRERLRQIFENKRTGQATLNHTENAASYEINTSSINAASSAAAI